MILIIIIVVNKSVQIVIVERPIVVEGAKLEKVLLILLLIQ